MSLDKFAEGDILSTCNALGSEINGVYEKGNDCIECLKDILRYLKKDNEDHHILRFLGSIRLLQTDLLPIIKRYEKDKDKEIFDFALRILVALTNPAILLYKEDVPDEKISRNTYLQIISYLQAYKAAFTDIVVWQTFYEHLKDLLKVRPIERSSNENLFIERIIILIRNVLHVPADESLHKLTNDDLSPHDKILQCLHQSKINILILYMSANEEEHKYCLHVLEIVSLMFCEHTAETLADSNETRSTAEKEKDLKLLLAARKREQSLKLQKIQSMYASRFNGVYCVKNMKSLSDNDYISHRPITSTDDVKFDFNKDSRRKPKNRVHATDVDNTRKSTLSIRLFLKKFSIEFLKTYNKLLVSVKRELLRKVSDDHDETYYLWAICYFMQFNRLYDFQPAFVSETISVQSFHHIQTQITNYQEMMLTDKKKTMFWARRIQLGVSAYKELLETLKVMERNEDKVIKDSADDLISHVFYVIEYREMLLSLLSNYDEIKFPLSYLAKLVESAQLFLKILENHSKKHSEIIVQKKQRKVHRRKKKKPVIEPVNVEDQLNEQWDAVTIELSEAVQGKHSIPDVTPFDGASNMSFEEQKIEAIHKIREALIGSEPIKALGLLRAARELWPDGDSFGAANIESEPELLILKEIHFSNLQRDPKEKTNIQYEDTDSNEDEEEMEALPSVSEQQLDINEVYKKYASHKVVQPCSLLFANYSNNKPETNACLIKLLHRIAWNCKMHALFFQSTIFLTFQKIFHDPDVNFNPIIKEFYKFARFIVKKFISAAEKNDKIFVELLFWKGSKEAYELEEGYGTCENNKKGWTENEEDELKYLFEENKDICIEGQDVADIILANINPRNKTKQQIIAALKRLELIKSVKDLKPEKRKEWQEAEIAELQNLYEDYKDSDNVMSSILNKLSIKRSRIAVVEKLLELNLIADRKEVRKKTSKHKKVRKSDSEGNSTDESEVDENYNQETHDICHSRNLSPESSGDEDEIFFKNLEAERLANNNESLHTDDENSHSKIKVSGIPITGKKVNRKKFSKVWEEQDIIKLTTLFQQHHDSDNVVDILLDSLSVKMPKQAIVEKLVELGLINDTKEIRRKIKSKKQNLSKLSKHGKDITDENSESDLENSVFDMKVKKIKERKKVIRHVLSDSSDEDVSLSSILKDSKINESEKLKRTKLPKEWKEEEIVELNQLFLEHKDSDDPISSILQNLTMKRTKKNIVEKMLEINLIKDKSEIKKKNIDKAIRSKPNNVTVKTKRKRQSENWEEQEMVQLNQLYQKFQGSDDIMTNILNNLTVKRNKKNVVEKMLEIGLIQDKKEIRKKRTKKIKAGYNSFEMTSSEEDISKSKDRQNLSTSIISLNSSDESVPLTNMDSSSLKSSINNSDKMYIIQSDSENSIDKILPVSRNERDLKDKLSNEESFLEKNENSEHSFSKNELSFKNNKRKRLQIINDDSSDDDSVANKLILGDTMSKITPISDTSESFQSYFKPKKQKKVCVLEDSDDSN